MSTCDVCSNLEPLQHVALLELMPEAVFKIVLYRVRLLPHLFAHVVKLKALKRHYCFRQNDLTPFSHLRLHEIREGLRLIVEITRVINVLGSPLLGLFSLGHLLRCINLLLFLFYLVCVVLFKHLLRGHTGLFGCMIINLFRLRFGLSLFFLSIGVLFIVKQLLMEGAQRQLLLLRDLHGTGPHNVKFGLLGLLFERETR